MKGDWIIMFKYFHKTKIAIPKWASLSLQQRHV